MPSPSTSAGAFRPRPMKLSILTAALQELTPREKREADPDLAIEEWLAFAAEIGAPNIELSCALHPTQSDVPAAALLGAAIGAIDPPASEERGQVAVARARAKRRSQVDALRGVQAQIPHAVGGEPAAVAALAERLRRGRDDAERRAVR